MDQIIMEKSNKSYNLLYPPPNERVSSFMKKIYNSQRLMKIGTFIDISSKCLYGEWIKKCRELYNTWKCKNCDRNHECYFIAGGYASYLAGHTTTFSDIDIYVNCNKLMSAKSYFPKNYIIKSNRNVVTIKTNQPDFPTVQIIQVDFDIDINKDSQNLPVLSDLMAMYVINKFDLPICRVAVKVSMNSGFKSGYIIDATTFTIEKEPSAPGRKQKYADRKSPDMMNNVCRLQVSILFQLLELYQYSDNKI